MKKIINTLIFVLILGYIGFCATVYIYPEGFFYNPTNTHSNLENIKKYDIKVSEVEYKSADDTDLYGWYVAPKNKNKIIVFMHGNSYNVEKFFFKMVPLIKAGYGVFMPEYRGFGGTKGRITQAGLEQDALAAVQYLHNKGWKNKDIIVYGMSLGSHMAVNTVYNLQGEGKFAALVLEVPFDSLLNVTKTIVPVPLPFDLIVRDKYDNTQMIQNIKSPILIMGGSKDTLVPVQLAMNLYRLAPQPKNLMVFEGAEHGNLHKFGNAEEIIKWLDKL